MSTDKYMRVSCPNCESQYAIDFLLSSVNGTPEYCPFCGEEIPEVDTRGGDDDGDEEESEDNQW